MTVCIAAMYQDGKGKTGIVTVNDWQITDTQTSFKSRGMKSASVTPHISILGAGDMTYFGDLVARTVAKVCNKDNVMVEDVADAYWEAEVDWQNEFREHHVLGKYNLNWKSYTEMLASNGLPDAFFAEVNQDLKTLQMPCSADAIIAGINIDHVAHIKSDRIIKIENGIRDSMSREGYAVIGEGNTIVTAEFGYAEYSRKWSKAKTIFLSYMAKKRSEVIASVGDTSLITIIDDHGKRLLTGAYKTRLDKVWRDLNRNKTKAEERAYEKAKTIIDEHDEEARRAPAQSQPDTSASV